MGKGGRTAVWLASLRRRADDDAGFSLVEVIVAITVFALVASAAVAMLINATTVTRGSRDRTVATGVANQQLELTRNAAETLFTQGAGPLGTAVVPYVVGRTTYTVTETRVWTPKSAPGSACDSSSQGGASGVQPALLVSESVTWPGMGGIKPVTTVTTLTPKAGDEPTNTGGIDTQIVNNAGTGVQGITVTVLSGATPVQSITTDSRGCAFLGFLASGAYTVNASSPGYIDNKELATSVASNVGVSSGAVTTLGFVYDQAATVSETLASVPTPALPVASAPYPFTLYNVGLAATNGAYAVTNATPLAPIFPYNSYNIWAGQCPEANPQAQNAGGGSLYPSAPLPPSVATTPGGGAAVTVPLNALSIKVYQPGGTILASGATLTATEAPFTAAAATGLSYAPGGAKTPCVTTNKYQLSPTDVTGTSLSGVPLGYFTVKATWTDATNNVHTKSTNVLVTPTGFVPATVTVTVV